jgi:hypothetical protein
MATKKIRSRSTKGSVDAPSAPTDNKIALFLEKESKGALAKMAGALHYRFIGEAIRLLIQKAVCGKVAEKKFANDLIHEASSNVGVKASAERLKAVLGGI